MLLFAALILLQKAYTTTILFLLTALVLFLAGGYKLRYIITFCAFLIVPALCFLFSESYRVKRIASFIFPDLDPSGLNWQINMSLAAIREGGIFGKGLGNGYYKLGSLPEVQNDFIFFTGSKSVGKLVMEKASRHLTPVALELGGKSPVIVEKDADIPLAARRIVFGKFLNCGQTCVAPDYILVNEEVRGKLVENLIRETKRQFGENPLNNEDYGKIINRKHYDRILSLIDEKKTVLGGKGRAEELRIEPTIMDGVTKEDKVMGEEIFGPVLPIVEYKDISDAISFIRSFDHPLAFYVFSKPRNARRIMNVIGFGGGCINDTIIHLATSEMGFGGFGESGMGSYHGKKGFMCFSHEASIVDKKRWIDLPMRYQKYRKFYRTLIRFFLK